MKITGIINETANNIIFLAENSAGKNIALKCIRNINPGEREKTFLQHEFGILKSLKIRGVPSVYEIGTFNEFFGFSFDYFDGVRFNQLLNFNRFTIKDFLKIACNIAETLGEIHAQNIIHRDINPSNILGNLKDHSIKIIDFGISSKISLKQPHLGNPEVLEGQLPYISPEQTGRMNRTVDYRSDLYSLGATFYEILTGELPFFSTDPLELVHCHIAKQPVFPSEKNKDVPPVLSKIVMKLLEKNAENRYQSAFILRDDLQKCLDLYEKTGEIIEFPVAQNNYSEYLQIPEKLYGREKEVDLLLDAFRRVGKGSAEILLIGGYSGVGKSALVNEVHKNITEKKGFFIAGKFDQYQKNVPYSAVSQALNAFVGLLLTENLESLNQRKDKFKTALGENAQVLIDFLPNLELVIGKQPPAAQLGAAESQNRFNNILINFFRTICEEKSPLVMFIDDLQWADSASLNLFKLLLTDEELRYFLLIGAYRDNEIYEKHPLRIKIEDMQAAAVPINEIHLGNLSEKDINLMLADCFQTAPHLTKPLTEVICEKTLGNAFFARQFLQNLYENELLKLNRSAGKFIWEWDVKKIRDLKITDNVVEFVSGKIALLNENCRDALKTASALGENFSLRLLSEVLELTPHETLTNLWQAVSENLLLPLDKNFNAVLYNPAATAEGESDARFAFLHDRIQQAAYSHIEKAEIPKLHHKIALLISQKFEVKTRQDLIFDIVGHFNQALSEIFSQEEKLRIAELNLHAAVKAKEAAAYQAATEYLSVAEKLLPENSWQKHYRLTCDIFLEAAECAYLSTNFERTKQIFQTVIAQTNEKLDLARIYDTMIVLYTNLGDMVQAVRYARTIIGILDEPIPDEAAKTGEKVGEKIGFIQQKMAETPVEDFFNFPAMENPEKIALMNILVKTVPPAYQTDQTLVGLIIALMAETSIKYGNAPHSSYGYDMFAILAAAALQDYRAAFRFGKLAVRLLNHLNVVPLKGAVYYVFGNFSSHWGQKLQKSIDTFREGFTGSIEAGDFIHTGYCGSQLLYHSFLHGHRLEDIIKEAQPYIDFLRQKKDLTCSELSVVVKRICFALAEPGSTLDNEEFEEAEFEKTFASNIFSLSHFYLLKIMQEYWSCRYENAFNLLEKAEKYMGGSNGSHIEAVFNFYQSLLLLRFITQKNEEEKASFLQKIAENQQKMQKWAEACPENYAHYFALIEAERYLLSNEQFKAVQTYNVAAEKALSAQFKMIEIIANERLAEFWFANDNKDYGRKHLQKAYYQTSIWGANVKKMWFEAHYDNAELFEGNLLNLGTIVHSTIHHTHHAQTITAGKRVSLDINSILKAYQTLSEEVNLSKLVEKMLRIIIENAGAQTGVLMENFNDEYYVQAVGDDFSVQKTEKIAVSGDFEGCPKSLIYFVGRSKQFFLSDNMTEDERFAKDIYIKKNQTKSVICFPVLKKDEISHIFYLENNISEGAFNENNLKILKALASQITISLENAVLYESLEQKVEQRTVMLQRALEEVEVKNTNIMHSIRYAQRIQEALLVSARVLNENFADSFIIYKPRDVVSGDFYWFAKHQEKTFLAAIDCTGHGVPGAFMSLISYNILQSVVLIHGEKDTDVILKKLNKNLIKMLRQKETGNTDGMDIALISLEDLGDKNFKKVSFSGAKRNFWYYNAEILQLAEVSGDRKNIGGDNNYHNDFTKHDFVISKNSVLFLWSDGFTDQSDAKSVRFGTKKFREIIAENAHLPLDEMRANLENALKLHQGKVPQRDDIMVIGVKI